MLQQQASSVSARIAQMALVDAYRKQFWRDAKTANALAECVFPTVQRIQVYNLPFYFIFVNLGAHNALLFGFQQG